MKVVTALLLVTLVFCSIFVDNTTAAATTTGNFLTAGLEKGYCDKQCGTRCAAAGMKDRCLKYCGICCNDCKCVPSGTYGNKHQCPCYRDKTNSKGKPKCP